MSTHPKPLSTHPEHQIARLRARFQAKAHQLGDVGFLLKGSVVRTRKRCSSPGCGCHSDPAKLHGPYWQWNGKVGGKMTSRALTEEQVSRYRQWLANSKQFEKIVQELYDLSSEANELLRTLERQPPEQTPAAAGPQRHPDR